MRLLKNRKKEAAIEPAALYFDSGEGGNKSERERRKERERE
jgi:hypothetical protein